MTTSILNSPRSIDEEAESTRFVQLLDILEDIEFPGVRILVDSMGSDEHGLPLHQIRLTWADTHRTSPGTTFIVKSTEQPPGIVEKVFHALIKELAKEAGQVFQYKESLPFLNITEQYIR